jgi:hypothetical protein
LSSTSGDTNTLANEVWRRLPESYGDFRTRRWTPGFGLAPAEGVFALNPDSGRLDTGHFSRRDFDQLGIPAALLGPAQVHSQKHFGPVLGLGAAGAGLDIDKQGRLSISPENMRWNSSSPPDARCAADHRHAGQRVSSSSSIRASSSNSPASRTPSITRVLGIDRAIQLGAFLAQLLGMFGIVPDVRVFQLAADLFEPFYLAIVVKDTP